MTTMKLTSLLGLSLFAVSLAACNPPCKPGTDVGYCDGNTALNCPEPGVDQLVGANQWKFKRCEAACVVADGVAFCAQSSTPSQTCGAKSTVCESETSQLYCQGGYATTSVECLTCEGQTDGGVSCTGRYGDDCEGDEQCVTGFVCTEGKCATDDSE